MSELTKEVNRTLHLVESLRLAARAGDARAAEVMVKLAVEFADAVEAMRVAKPELAASVACRHVVWPAVLRNRPEALKDTAAALSLLGLGAACGLNARHAGTVPRRKGQDASSYINRCAEDAIKDVDTLRRENRKGCDDAPCIEAGQLGPMGEDVDGWATVAWRVHLQVVADFWEHPKIRQRMKAPMGCARREIEKQAKRIKARAKAAVQDGAPEIRQASAEHKAADKLADAETKAEQAGRIYIEAEFKDAVRRLLRPTPKISA